MIYVSAYIFLERMQSMQNPNLNNTSQWSQVLLSLYNIALCSVCLLLHLIHSQVAEEKNGDIKIDW